jgi:hypothetical protein
VNCWDNFQFNATTCEWENVGTQDAEPTKVNCWDNFQFNATTCQWENVGTQDAAPTASVTAQPTCAVATGTITVTAPTGSDITYSIGGAYQSSGTFSGVNPGPYQVTAKNGAGCISAATSVTVAAQPTDCGGYQGCTPGYWKNHPASWGCGYVATGRSATKYFSAFNGIKKTNYRGLDANLTMFSALDLGGGDYASLARASSAALLNACHNGVNYQFTMTEIKAAVVSMFNTGSATLKGLPYTNAGALAIVFDNANNAGCPLGNTPSSRNITPSETESIRVNTISVSAFPNPYTDKVNFMINAPQAGQGSLEVFNLLGQKVKTVYQGHIFQGMQSFQMNVPATERSMLIYRFTLNGTQLTGKV